MKLKSNNNKNLKKKKKKTGNRGFGGQRLGGAPRPGPTPEVGAGMKGGDGPRQGLPGLPPTEAAVTLEAGRGLSCETHGAPAAGSGERPRGPR